MRATALDRAWDELMALCAKEAELKLANRHPKLVNFLGTQIDRLAKELGFGEGQIEQREFRALKQGGHVVRMLTRSASR